MPRRQRSVPHTFEENIAAQQFKLEAQVARLKPGSQMDQLMKKLRELETVCRMNEWLATPGLRSPE